MESKGKYVTLDGSKVDCDTAPCILASWGPNGQHCFYQMIHHGTRLIPCDFIAFGQTLNPLGRHHDILLALREDGRAGPGGGDSGSAGAPPRFRGQPPVEHDFGRESDPETLGKLIALYEHNVFTPGTIWGMDSFDPWGVELGKQLAQRIVPELESKEEPALAHDSSTNNLINHYRQLKEALWRLST